MDNVLKLKRKPRPLKKTYQPMAPYVAERCDDDFSVCYEVMDERPESYRRVCVIDDDEGRNGYAKHDAEQIARGLNLMVQFGKETLPNVKDREMDDDFGGDNE